MQQQAEREILVKSSFSLAGFKLFYEWIIVSLKNKMNIFDVNIKLITKAVYT